MKLTPLAKLELIKKIATDLQQRMTFADIDTYLSEYKVYNPSGIYPNSKRVYVEELLSGVKSDILLEIAKELKIEVNNENDEFGSSQIDTSIWKPGHFKLFISHLAAFKEKVSLLKTELEKYGISSFVAHEDIEPTHEWMTEIEKGLFTMDALCAILMEGFKESNWTDQEVGVAIGRKVLVIPIKKGLDPYGFIGKYQAYQTNNKNIVQVAKAIFDILKKSEKTKFTILNNLIDLFLLANNQVDALNYVKLISQFDSIPIDKIKTLNDNFLSNKNLKSKEILNEINMLFMLNNFRQFKLADFDYKSDIFIDDLPF